MEKYNEMVMTIEDLDSLRYNAQEKLLDIIKENNKENSEIKHLMLKYKKLLNIHGNLDYGSLERNMRKNGSDE